MCNHNKDIDTSDLAVGMRFDDDAKKITYGNRTIKLPNKDNKFEGMYPEITPIFKKLLRD